ncbi:hypothetical protein CFC21_066869 [Triticum aestivum]|uniref:Uncharacterized protein n=3 Tax=Triticum TaxID=4564 RepID=A0A9R0TX02_TRITD|nr:hypothetical protein CFC21_066869 [Triticum aestivum]VAI20037.1 unnamed protein product [Triticum turgidum subsp. durum]
MGSNREYTKLPLTMYAKQFRWADETLPSFSQHTNETKNRRERERYAQNREEILKRQRQTPTGQEAVTQLQNITGLDGALPTLRPYNGFIQTDKENISDNDESDWLHRNDAYQMHPCSRRMTLTQPSGVDNPQLNTVVNLRTPGVTFHDKDFLGDQNLGETGDVDPDEEARMFARPDVDFESYRVARHHGDGTITNEHHDRTVELCGSNTRGLHFVAGREKLVYLLQRLMKS